MARSGRILVVDDEVNARSALAELLTDEGFQVETAADAFKALGKFETFLPHIVITDLKMPGMDGIELVRKLRASEEAPAVIVMTAFGAVATAVEAMRAGAAEYLVKPLNFDELLIQIDKVFDTVLQVAPSRASVLITGESGTGKELIAAAIHEHSPRAASAGGSRSRSAPCRCRSRR